MRSIMKLTKTMLLTKLPKTNSTILFITEKIKAGKISLSSPHK